MKFLPFYIQRASQKMFYSPCVYVFSMSLVGCGSIPNAQVSYYQAKTLIKVKVTRSVICDINAQPLIIDTVEPQVKNSADPDRQQFVDLSGLHGAFTDSDIKLKFYDDGRLLSVNAEQTGQGEEIIKAATTFAATLAAFAVTKNTPSYAEECAYVKSIGGGKPITLIYEKAIDLNDKSPQEIPLNVASSIYETHLQSILPKICFAFKNVSESKSPPFVYKFKENDILLSARQPALLDARVGFSKPGNYCSDELWQGRVSVAQLGSDYKLPIPRPAIFGKQIFSAEFAESGALINAQYSTTDGSFQVLGAANLIATLTKRESTSDKVEQIKSEADLIMQQQRLLQCRTTPVACK